MSRKVDKYATQLLPDQKAGEGYIQAWIAAWLALILATTVNARIGEMMYDIYEHVVKS